MRQQVKTSNLTRAVRFGPEFYWQRGLVRVDATGLIVTPHNLLSKTHPDTYPADVIRGDVITGQSVSIEGLISLSESISPSSSPSDSMSASPSEAPNEVIRWSRLAIGANSYVLTSNGTDAYWAPPTASTAHNLLSLTHTDTEPASVVRGDLITGQGSTAKWSRLALGSSGYVLTSDGTDAYWAAPTTADTHKLLSLTHTDTTPADVVRGDIVTGQGSSATWTRLAIGTIGQVVTSNGTDVYWATPLGLIAHNLLSATHTDTTAASVVQGDIIVGQSQAPNTKWKRLGIQIPSATHVNYLATYTTDIEPAWKPLFDDTAPTNLTVGASPSAGTSLYAAHRDHTHGSPATWTAIGHKLLSVTHIDTTPADVQQGDIIVGKGYVTHWERYGRIVPDSNYLNVLALRSTDFEPIWYNLLSDSTPSTLAAGATPLPGTSIEASRSDHTHGGPATWPATPHNLLSATHTDTMYSEIVQGDIIVRGVSKWYNRSMGAPSAGYSITLQVRNGNAEPYWYDDFTATLPSTVSPGGSSSTGTSMFFSRSDHTHGGGSGLIGNHNLLSTAHSDTTPDSVQRGDLIVGTGYLTTWKRYGISIPASNYLNVLAVTSTDTEPAWWSIFNSTVPSTITAGATGSAGTSTQASRSDHSHPSPSTFPATAHNLLSATHGDTEAASVVQGDLIIGRGTFALWKRLPIFNPSSGGMSYLGLQSTSIEPSWTSLYANYDPIAITIGAVKSQGSSQYAARIDHVHGSPSTWTATAHNLLSSIHGDTEAASVVRGDIVVGSGTSPKWTRRAIGIPSSGMVNVLAVYSSDLEPYWYTIVNNSTPTSITVGATASPGTAVTASRNDHTHGAPSTWTATAHNLLSSIHGDTTAASAVRGDIIVGIGASPKWTRYSIGAAASNSLVVLGVANADTEPTWKTLFTTANPVDITVAATADPGTSLQAAHRDHRHASPSAWSPTTHNLLSNYHGDANSGSVTRGDIIYGWSNGSTTKWDRLPLGTNGYVLQSNGTDVYWGSVGSGAHSLLSATHSDTSSASCSRGALIVGNSSSLWSKMSIGTSGYFLKSNGSDASWSTHGLTYSDVGACSTTDYRLSDSRPASDVYSWAKASSKPTYTYSEVGAFPANHGVSTNYLARATSSTAFGNSLIRDNGSYIGIGKTGTCLLDVNGQINGSSITTGDFYSNHISDSGSTVSISVGTSEFDVYSGWVQSGTPAAARYYIVIYSNSTAYYVPCSTGLD